MPAALEPGCLETVSWFCPACYKWFETLKETAESRTQSKARIREDHFRKGCPVCSPSAKPAVPPLSECPRCGCWHGGERGGMCYSCRGEARRAKP